MKNFIQIGDVLDHTAGANLTSGQVVVMGARIGIAVTDIADGQSGAVRVKGVVELAKASSDVVAQGALLYWSADNGNLTVTSAGNTLAGYAAAAAGAGATTVRLHLNA